MPVVWKITQLDCYPNFQGREQVVCQAHWRAEAAEGDASVSVYGTVGFELDPKAKFKPFEKLTEKDVLSWAHAKMGEDFVADAERRVLAELADKITPTVETVAVPRA